MFYLKLTCTIVCACMSSICSDPHVRWMQIRGNDLLCYVAAGRHCFVSSKRYDVSFSTCVEFANDLVRCTSACVPSVLPGVPSVFISSWSKYSSLWLSVSFEFSRASMPGFFDITVRVGRRVMASLAPTMHLFIQWFAMPHPRHVDP